MLGSSLPRATHREAFFTVLVRTRPAQGNGRVTAGGSRRRVQQRRHCKWRREGAWPTVAGSGAAVYHVHPVHQRHSALCWVRCFTGRLLAWSPPQDAWRRRAVPHRRAAERGFQQMPQALKVPTM